VVDYSYDPGDRVTQIKTTIGGTVYTMDYSYKANTDLTSEWLYKQGVTTLATDDFTYNALRLLTEEKVTSGGGSTLFHRKYGYDTMLRRTKVEDPVSGWQSLFAYDAASRMLRVTTSAGGGANPFPWPSGLTTVNTDRNGNILRMLNGSWWVAHEFDYEQRLTRVRASNGDVMENLMDALGNRLKQLKTSGGSTTETRFVNALGRLLQERNASDAVTARYYWGNTGAGNGFAVFKKDNGDSAKYVVSDERQSPLQDFNKDSSLAGARAYDAFGVTNYTSGTALTPFEVMANLRLSGSQITLTAQGRPYYPEIGQNVDGGFRLAYFNGAGGAGGGCIGNCGPIYELHPAMPRKGPGGTLPLPYPPEPEMRKPPLPCDCILVETIAARPPNDPFAMPHISVPPGFCCIMIAAHRPCAGGGPPGETSGCDWNNIVYGGAGADEHHMVLVQRGVSRGYVNVCQCRLRRKVCATAPDSDKDACNFKLDCGKEGWFDVSNGHLEKMLASVQACERNRDRPCEQIVTKTPGPLGIEITEYSCENLCECLGATGGMGRSCYPACMMQCQGHGSPEELDASLDAWVKCVGKEGGTTAICIAGCLALFQANPILYRLCVDRCKTLLGRIL
jgi:hypothetical protein